MNKKYVFLLAAAGGAMALFSGCGQKKDGATDYSKYVDLGPYTGMTVDRIVTTITDEDVQEEVDIERSYSAEYSEITDRGAQDGDIINVDYTGTIDGVAFEGGSEDDVEIELGAGLYLEEFESQFAGMKSGEEKTFKLTFPEPYDGELDGKEAEFQVKMNSIYEVVLPEYNDEYVAGISDFNTVADYEADIKAELQSEYDADSQNMACEDALAMVVDASSFSGYPEDLYNACKEEIDAQNAELLEEFDMDDLSDLYGEDYDQESLIEEAVNERMVVSTIAAKEKLTISDEEYKAQLEEDLQDTDYSSVEEYEADIDQEAYRYSLLREKVLAYLAENNTFRDVSSEDYYSDEELELGDLDLGDMELLGVDDAEADSDAGAETDAAEDTEAESGAE